MNEGIDKAALTRFLLGESTEEEERRVRTWLNDHPTLRANLESGEQLPSNYDDRRDGEAASGRVLRRAVHPGRTDRAPVSGGRRRFSRSTKIVLGMVAVLLVVMAGREMLVQDATLRSYSTASGERLQIELPDGSMVELNVASRLVLAEDFGTSSRTVLLDGEAYFQVSADSERPFVVMSNALQVRVLGTSFGVGAYAVDPEASVVVREGVVSLEVVRSSSGRSGENAEAQVLRAGQQASVVDGVVRTGTADTTSVLAWRNGQLVLQGTTMAEAARRIERWYSIEIELSEEINDSLRIDVVFTDQSAEEAVSIIAAVLGLRYELRERRVLFSK